MADELTARQRQILRFIDESTRLNGYPPTIREVGDAFEIVSTNAVNDHLAALERKGVLRRDTQKSRAIVVTEAGQEALR